MQSPPLNRTPPKDRLCRFMSVLCLTVMLLSGCRNASRDQQLMPLAVGNRWSYLVHTPDSGKSLRVLEIIKDEGDGVYSAVDGGEPGLWTWQDGFLSVQQRGRRIYLLAVPATTGTGWWTVTPEGAKVWCKIAGRRRVEVSAGVFPSCVEVVMVPLGGRTEMRHWFAPGVGWIKYCYGPRGKEPWMVRELTDFRPGGSGN